MKSWVLIDDGFIRIIDNMIINSNDIFSQIGLALDPKPPKPQPNHNPPSAPSVPKYVICLQIELTQDEKHILEVKDYDDPHSKAYQFCREHKLNKLAVGIVEEKIREAMRFQEERLGRSAKRRDGRKQGELSKSRKNNTNNNVNTNNNTKKQSPNPKKSRPQKSPTPNSPSPNSKSKSKSKMSKTASSDNIYLRGLVKSRLQQQQRNKKKVQIQRKQEEKLTFKPKINHVSQKIVEFLRSNDVPKLKKASPPKKMYDEMAECTFKPKLNKVSERIVSNKSIIKQQRQHHKKLFEQDNPNKPNPKKPQQPQQYPFKPTINPKSSQKITIPFFKRLQITQQKKNQALNKQTFYDQEQCSFKPKINRGPFRDRDKENLNIWDYLYNGAKKEDAATGQDSNSGQVVKEGAASASQQYYQNLIEDRINSVFDTLDSNRDGYISPNEIAIELLPTQCLHFLKPIFVEMDQINATLNCYEFKKAVKALMADSDPGVKGAFIAAKWKKQIEQRQSFRPNINKKSKLLTANRSIQNLYKEGLKQKQNRQYRLQKERALKEEKQLMECSFKPALSHSSKVYIDKISKKKTELKPNKSISELAHSFMQSQDDQ